MASRQALVLAVLLPFTGPALATDCPVPIPKDGDRRTTYGPRTGGYCDGQLSTLHGGRLRALAVRVEGTRGGSSPPLAVDVVAARPQEDAVQTIRFQGLPLDASINYRFDARLESGHLPLSIGADAALWELDLAPADVGWTAWSQAPGEERIFWPVSVGAAKSGAVEIVVRSALQVAVVRPTVHDVSGEVSRHDFALNVPPGQPIPFVLPTGDAGLVRVDLVVEGADGISSESLSISLWRPGQ